MTIQKIGIGLSMILRMLMRQKIVLLLILLIPATAFFVISQLEPGTYYSYQLFGFDLNLLRVDKLSKVFGYVFTLNAFGCFLFSQHLKERYEQQKGRKRLRSTDDPADD